MYLCSEDKRVHYMAEPLPCVMVSCQCGGKECDDKSDRLPYALYWLRDFRRPAAADRSKKEFSLERGSQNEWGSLGYWLCGK